MSDDYNKKNKKLEKKVSQLEKALDEALLQLRKEGENRDTDRKKFSKKLEN